MDTLHQKHVGTPVSIEDMMIMENFKRGGLAEAVDTLGVWARCRVLESQKDLAVVTFLPWPKKWNRRITDPSEIRSLTEYEVLVDRTLQHSRVSDTRIIL